MCSAIYEIHKEWTKYVKRHVLPLSEDKFYGLSPNLSYVTANLI